MRRLTVIKPVFVESLELDQVTQPVTWQEYMGVSTNELSRAYCFRLLGVDLWDPTDRKLKALGDNAKCRRQWCLRFFPTVILTCNLRISLPVLVNVARWQPFIRGQ